MHNPTVAMSLTVPPGMRAGQPMQFTTPGGQQLQVVIPVGVQPGQSFVFQVPAAVTAPPAHPVVDAVPIGSNFVPMGTSSAVPMGDFIPIGGNSVPMGLPVEARTLPPAQRYAECPICYEPLHLAPVGVFLNASGGRVSNHFFNLEAARGWLAGGNGLCPLTRQPIGRVLPVPDVRTDPDGWFKACDVDGDGRLSRAEAIECIKAQFPLDVAALDSAVSDGNHWLWEQWDIDRSGWLERDELLAPTGLVNSVSQMFATERARAAAAPDMRRDKAAWFDFWDEDRSGELDKEEVVRALLKTFGLTSDQSQVASMRSTVHAIWPIFDADGSGSIDRAEFVQPDGLADTVLATAGH